MSDDILRLGRERRFLVLLGVICLALIGGALYMQVARHWVIAACTPPKRC